MRTIARRPSWIAWIFGALCLLAGQAGAFAPMIAITKGAWVGGVNGFSIDSSGRLFGWGADTYGQLGQGVLLSSPTQMLVNSGHQTVSVGGNRIERIKTDGCSQPRARLRHQGVLGQQRYSAVGCMNEAITTFTRTGVDNGCRVK